jgi:hypothetical protein
MFFVMINEQLLNYVSGEFQKGNDAASVKKLLVEKGWNDADIDSAITKAKGFTSEKINDKSFQEQQKPIVELLDTKHSKKLNKKLVLLIIVLLIVTGLGLFAYSEVYLAPDRVFARSMKKMVEVKSLKYDGTIGFRVKGNLFSSTSEFSGLGELFKMSVMSYDLNFSGAMDYLDNGSNPKSQVHLNLRSNNQDVLDLETINVDLNEMYVFVHDIADLASLGVVNSDIYLGKWIRLNANEIAGNIGADISLYDKSLVDEEKMQKIREIIAEENPIVIEDNLKSEMVDGVQTYHYSFKVDSERLTNIILRTNEIIMSTPLSNLEKDNLEKTTSKMQFFGGEVWIGKKDLYLRRIKLSVNMKEDDSSFDITLGSDLYLGNINQIQEITKPQDYVDAMDVYEDYLKALNFPEEPSNVEFLEDVPTDFKVNMFPNEQYDLSFNRNYQH